MNKNKVKTVVFLSNYFNHHQKPFSDAMFRKLGNGYKFVATVHMDEERQNMGWKMDSCPEYVYEAIETPEIQDVQKLIDEADVVIIGSAPELLVKKRIQNNKIVFRYSERVIKQGYEYWKIPVRAIKSCLRNRLYKNTYMLCASAYAAADYGKLFAYVNRAYKWGYFTELKQYDNINYLISKKQPASILWVARLIEWKHPKFAIEIAKSLKADGYTFTLNIIGNGPLEETIKSLIEKNDLSDCVHMLGVMSPEQVRNYMEQSEIFMFTSDRSEGWGAVLNESMNSACAVVANHIIGSVPFLLNDGENGLIYKDGDIDELYTKIKWLLEHPVERKVIAKNAYSTIINEWNADNAAERFITLAEEIVQGKKHPILYKDGVCSKAKMLKDDWYRNE